MISQNLNLFLPTAFLLLMNFFLIDQNYFTSYFFDFNEFKLSKRHYFNDNYSIFLIASNRSHTSHLRPKFFKVFIVQFQNLVFYFYNLKF